jgi:hypothetical protein
VKKNKTITQEDIKSMARLVEKESKTTTDSAKSAKARRDIGFGYGYFGFTARQEQHRLGIGVKSLRHSCRPFACDW